MADITDWTNYYKVHKERKARELLIKTFELFDKDNFSSGIAFDLGCGNGHETYELLKKGWQVTAVDNNENVPKLMKEISIEFKDRLKIQITSFENIKWTKCDLINANYSLPFCPEEHFEFVWDNIINSLNINGRFSGQLFGDRDEWDLVRHTKEQALKRFEGMALEFFVETEKDDKTASGELKHWHLFDIIARKLK